MLPPPHLGRVVSIHVEVVARHARQEVAAHAVGEGDGVVARGPPIGGQPHLPGRGGACTALTGAIGARAVGHGRVRGVRQQRQQDNDEGSHGGKQIPRISNGRRLSAIHSGPEGEAERFRKMAELLQPFSRSMNAHVRSLYVSQ